MSSMFPLGGTTNNYGIGTGGNYGLSSPAAPAAKTAKKTSPGLPATIFGVNPGGIAFNPGSNYGLGSTPTNFGLGGVNSSGGGTSPWDAIAKGVSNFWNWGGFTSGTGGDKSIGAALNPSNWGADLASLLGSGPTKPGDNPLSLGDWLSALNPANWGKDIGAAGTAVKQLAGGPSLLDMLGITGGGGGGKKTEAAPPKEVAPNWLGAPSATAAGTPAGTGAVGNSGFGTGMGGTGLGMVDPSAFIPDFSKISPPPIAIPQIHAYSGQASTVPQIDFGKILKGAMLPTDYKGVLFPATALAALSKIPIAALSKQALTQALSTLNPQVQSLQQQQQFDISQAQRQGGDLMRNALAAGAAMTGVPEAVGAGYRSAANTLGNLASAVLGPLGAAGNQATAALAAQGAPTSSLSGVNLATLPADQRAMLGTNQAILPAASLLSQGGAAQATLSLLAPKFAAEGLNQAQLTYGAGLQAAQALQPKIQDIMARLPGLTATNLTQLVNMDSKTRQQTIQNMIDVYKAGGYGMTEQQAATLNNSNAAKNLSAMMDGIKTNANIAVGNAKNQTSVSVGGAKNMTTASETAARLAENAAATTARNWTSLQNSASRVAEQTWADAARINTQANKPKISISGGYITGYNTATGQYWQIALPSAGKGKPPTDSMIEKVATRIRTQSTPRIYNQGQKQGQYILDPQSVKADPENPQPLLGMDWQTAVGYIQSTLHLNEPDAIAFMVNNAPVLGKQFLTAYNAMTPEQRAAYDAQVTGKK